MALHGFNNLASPYLESPLELSHLFSINSCYLHTLYLSEVTYTLIVDCSLTPALNDIVHAECWSESLVKHLVELQSLDDVIVLGVVVAIVIHQSNLTIPMDNQHLDDWLRPIKSTSYIAKADNSRRSRHIKEHDLLIIEREHVYDDGDLAVLVEGNEYHCRELILSTHEFIDENGKRTKITEKLIIEGVIIASVRILKCNRIL